VHAPSFEDKEHAAEMAALKDEHAELADVKNHNLNDELNTAKEQNERLIGAAHMSMSPRLI
jgi:hypothetical protein